jgi:hypothetical protein
MKSSRGCAYIIIQGNADKYRSNKHYPTRFGQLLGGDHNLDKLSTMESLILAQDER